MNDKILIDRTALEHAIEACNEVIVGWQSLAPLALLIAATESLDELRAALKQQEQMFMCGGTVVRLSPEQAAALEQQEKNT